MWYDYAKHCYSSKSKIRAGIKLANTDQIFPNSLLPHFVVDALKLLMSPLAICVHIPIVFNSLCAARQRTSVFPSFSVIFCHALCSNSSITFFPCSSGGPHSEQSHALCVL